MRAKNEDSVKRTALIVAVAVVLVAATTVVLVARIFGPHSDGPLTERPAHGWAVPAEPGQVIVDGLEVLTTDEGEATITSVSIDADPSEVELIGAMVAGSGREIGAVQLIRTWPPSAAEGLGELRPAIGAVVTTEATEPWGQELILAMKTTKPGHFLRKGITIEYEVNGKHYTSYLPGELTFCSADFMNGDECPFLGEGP